jgi:hypothetical protein
MKRANTSTILGHLYKSRCKSRRPKYIRNHFQGALVFPPFGLLVEADALCPLKYELASLEQAMKVFKESHPEEALYRFLSCFNSFNHYSMVAYPVRMHCDHFHCGKESLENKILFCLNPNIASVAGRGGCLVCNSNVYLFA